MEGSSWPPYRRRRELCVPALRQPIVYHMPVDPGTRKCEDVSNSGAPAATYRGNSPVGKTARESSSAEGRGDRGDKEFEPGPEKVLGVM